MLADIRLRELDWAVVAQLTGEIDQSNADSIRQALVDTVTNCALRIVLDLSGVDYLDSGGIRLIYQLREQLRARGQMLELVVPATSPTSDTLRMAGVLKQLKAKETLDEARGERPSI